MKQIQIHILSKSVSCGNKNLSFKKFIPHKNLFYCNFAEKIIPTNNTINKNNKKIYHINLASDIQRFCYTFIGFSSIDQIKTIMEKTSLKSVIIDQSIFLYPNKINQIIFHETKTVIRNELRLFYSSLMPLQKDDNEVEPQLKKEKVEKKNLEKDDKKVELKLKKEEEESINCKKINQKKLKRKRINTSIFQIVIQKINQT